MNLLRVSLITTMNPLKKGIYFVTEGVAGYNTLKNTVFILGDPAVILRLINSFSSCMFIGLFLKQFGFSYVFFQKY